MLIVPVHARVKPESVADFIELVLLDGQLHNGR
jgi:hypothetical protein